VGCGVWVLVRGREEVGGVWCFVVVAWFEEEVARLLEASAKEAEKTVRQERTAEEGWHWRFGG